MTRLFVAVRPPPDVVALLAALERPASRAALVGARAVAGQAAPLGPWRPGAGARTPRGRADGARRRLGWGGWGPHLRAWAALR